MNTSNNTWASLLASLKKDFPKIAFKPGQTFFWSPEKQTIFYNAKQSMPQRAWSLLHELSHGVLAHADYKTDFELLKMEAEAWSKAQKIAIKYSLEIDQEHIQSCLDTYRDWLHRRSTCPTCQIRTLQKDEDHYQCTNCYTTWAITNERFSRPYRKTVSKI